MTRQPRGNSLFCWILLIGILGCNKIDRLRQSIGGSSPQSGSTAQLLEPDAESGAAAVAKILPPQVVEPKSYRDGDCPTPLPNTGTNTDTFNVDLATGCLQMQLFSYQNVVNLYYSDVLRGVYFDIDATVSIDETGTLNVTSGPFTTTFARRATNTIKYFPTRNLDGTWFRPEYAAGSFAQGIQQGNLPLAGPATAPATAPAPDTILKESVPEAVAKDVETDTVIAGETATQDAVTDSDSRVLLEPTAVSTPPNGVVTGGRPAKLVYVNGPTERHYQEYQVGTNAYYLSKIVKLGGVSGGQVTQTLTFKRNTVGTLEEISDSFGNKILAQYYTDGRLKGLSGPTTRDVVSFDWANGNRIANISMPGPNAGSRLAPITYDDNGRLQELRDISGAGIRYGRVDGGKIQFASTVAPNGDQNFTRKYLFCSTNSVGTTAITADPFGHANLPNNSQYDFIPLASSELLLSAMTNPLGRKTTLTYDATSGLMTSVRDFKGIGYKYAYHDGTVRVREMRHAKTDNVIMTTELAAMPGEVIDYLPVARVIDGFSGLDTRFTYDGAARPISTQVGSWSETLSITAGSSSADATILTKQAGNLTWTARLNDKGLLQGFSGPSGSTLLNGFTAEGLPSSSRVNPPGKMHTVSYDRQLPTSINRPDLPSETLSYTENGSLSANQMGPISKQFQVSNDQAFTSVVERIGSVSTSLSIQREQDARTTQVTWQGVSLGVTTYAAAAPPPDPICPARGGK